MSQQGGQGDSGVPPGVMNILGQMDPSAIEDGLKMFLDRYVQPHLEDIQERAQDRTPPEEVRVELAGRDVNDRLEIMQTTIAELVVSISTLRLRPQQGMMELKRMMRDPYTIEALLLVFDDDIFAEEELVQEGEMTIEEAQKATCATWFNWMGVAVAPEMYAREEVEAVVEEVGLSTELVDKWDESSENGEGPETSP